MNLSSEAGHTAYLLVTWELSVIIRLTVKCSILLRNVILNNVPKMRRSFAGNYMSKRSHKVLPFNSKSQLTRERKNRMLKLLGATVMDIILTTPNV